MSSEAKIKDPHEASSTNNDNHALNRRDLLLGTSTLVAAASLTSSAIAQAQKTAPGSTAPAAAPSEKKPNILVIFGDDIGQTNLSTYSFGMMGYTTPNIDRIADEGMKFTDYYAEQSCTAGRSTFITGQCTLRTGLSKVGIPGAKVGLQPRDATIAELLKPLGYSTGQFGKNHLGDRDELPITASMSSSAISIISTQKRNLRRAPTRPIPNTRRNSARAGSSSPLLMVELKTAVH